MSRRKHTPVHLYTYNMVDELLASPTEPMPEAKRTLQLSRMWEGLVAMETGAQPKPIDWRYCSDAVNLLETLVREMHVAEDTTGLLQDAIAALAHAGQRHRTHGTIRLDGPGMRAVRMVLESYADLIEQLPARTVVRAHRLTEKRIYALYSGKRRPHDVEVISL
ncbi:hypothetical protein [Hydrogenophaga sp.]|uniref:hypothetical protein n=1 Tax=Hydrogenophaga sp. TaxID=1904254 RepID=UPI0027287E26|nr:hypothetical protein [Hydrogenophaga sp.]MDO8902939.1 hypothetical protein [Hydrogenophaga sp.]